MKIYSMSKIQGGTNDMKEITRENDPPKMELSPHKVAHSFLWYNSF